MEKNIENLVKEYNKLVEKSEEFDSPFRIRKLTNTKPVERGEPVLYFEGYFECMKCGKKVKCLIARPVKKLNTYVVISENKMLDGHSLLCDECQKKELSDMIGRVKKFIKNSKDNIKHREEVKAKIEEIKNAKKEYGISDLDLRP